ELGREEPPHAGCRAIRADQVRDVVHPPVVAFEMPPVRRARHTHDSAPDSPGARGFRPPELVRGKDPTVDEQDRGARLHHQLSAIRTDEPCSPRPTPPALQLSELRKMQEAVRRDPTPARLLD